MLCSIEFCSSFSCMTVLDEVSSNAGGPRVFSKTSQRAGECQEGLNVPFGKQLLLIQRVEVGWKSRWLSRKQSVRKHLAEIEPKATVYRVLHTICYLPFRWFAGTKLVPMPPVGGRMTEKAPSANHESFAASSFFCRVGSTNSTP